MRPLLDALKSGTMTLPGKDGRDYVVRPIAPTDAPSLIRGYDAMTDRGKWFRLLYTVPHLSEDMAKQFCAPNLVDEVCAVVDGTDDLDGEILGGARVMGIGDGMSPEFSVSLRPEARGLGLARGTLELVIDIAREAGSKDVWGSIAAENAAMLGLAERIGFSIKRDPDDFRLRKAVLPLN